MLYLYQSNSVKHLCEWLITKISKPLPDPLINEQIIVHSTGVAQWLQQQIALKTGIAAGIKFPFPGTFIWKFSQQIFPDIPEQSSFTRDAMTWKMVNFLPECLQNSIFLQLNDYFDLNDNYDFKIYQFANKMAQIFDQYLIYRPDWINSWENNQINTNKYLWQPYLWNQLVNYVRSLNQSTWHRANLYPALIKALTKKIVLPNPLRLFVFGVTTLPPVFLQTLQAISQHIDIYMLVHNPCKFFWDDISDVNETTKSPKIYFSQSFLQRSQYLDGNHLLASMGKMFKDYHSYLYDLDFFIEDHCFLEPLEHRNTLLANLQSQILNLQTPHNCSLPIDDSLVMHSCYSSLREIEVLHDYLLNILEKCPTLQLGDIVIMAPEIETYIPFIQAVFLGNSAKTRLPVSISDRNLHNENPILTALLKLLNLPNTRCTVTEIINLLEVPAIMRRYKLKLPQLNNLKKWIVQAGIRWGINAQHKKKLAQPANDLNTWKIGIQRMLLGYAMRSSADLFNDISPLDNIEGLNAESCGLLIEFINDLETLLLEITIKRDLIAWLRWINQILNHFFVPDELESQALQLVREQLNLLYKQIPENHLSRSLAYITIQSWIIKKISQDNITTERFSCGQINVCQLMPMRSIPFKVVCLLGMNDGAYPRIMASDPFNLMNRHPRCGDRYIRDDDRYLFLEAILAAKDYLYISYHGRDINDNSVHTPSLLITEVIEYLNKYFGNSTDEIDFLQHPLHPFSYKYFAQNSQYYSYAKEWLPKALSINKDFYITKIQSNIQQSVVQIEELKQFYQHPCKYFFQHFLQVYFATISTPIDDYEPFTLPSLAEYQLKNTFLQQFFAKSLTQYKKFALSSGCLSHGYFGELQLKKIITDMENFLSVIGLHTNCSPHSLNLNLQIQNISLQGRINDIYAGHLVRFKPVKKYHKFLVVCLIEHLIWCSSTQNARDTLIFTLNNQMPKIRIKRLTIASSKDILFRWLKPFLFGELLPFFPETSLNCKLTKNISHLLLKEINHDDYWLRVWREITNELIQQTIDLAQYLLEGISYEKI